MLHHETETFGPLEGYAGQPETEHSTTVEAHRPLIGICGRIGSGKTFAADHLIAKHGYIRKKMAGPLKDMLRSVGLTDEHIEGRLKEVPCQLLCGRTPRHAMQTLGTEWGREAIHEDLWIRLWENSIAGLPKVVVDDVRFENEAQAVRQAGGIVVRLTTVEDMVDQPEAHSSEDIDFDADFTIFNAKDASLLPMIDLIAVTRKQI